MENFNEMYLEENRLGNNATDKEWVEIKKALCYGYLNNEIAKVCYKNIKENKKWYYKINRGRDEVIFGTGLLYTLQAVVGLIVTFILSCSTWSGTELEQLALFGAEELVAAFVIIKIPNKLLYENDIVQFQKSLEKAIYPNRITRIKNRVLSLFPKKSKKKTEVKQSLVDYVDKELAERGTNQDAEITKRQNEEHSLPFNVMIGNDIKSIYANPYPNCQKDIDALQQLSDDYTEYIIKEKEAKATRKINLILSSSQKFYNRLRDLEDQIENNMEINKLRQYNRGYIADIVKDASKAIKQDSQFIYNGPVVNGHIPTVEEQFYAESQNYDTADTENKGRGRVLSPNNK